MPGPYYSAIYISEYHSSKPAPPATVSLQLWGTIKPVCDEGRTDREMIISLLMSAGKIKAINDPLLLLKISDLRRSRRSERLVWPLRLDICNISRSLLAQRLQECIIYNQRKTERTPVQQRYILSYEEKQTNSNARSEVSKFQVCIIVHSLKSIENKLIKPWKQPLIDFHENTLNKKTEGAELLSFFGRLIFF